LRGRRLGRRRFQRGLVKNILNREDAKVDKK
jgi:hypothetical protein